MFSSFSLYAKLHSCVDLRPGIYAMRKITYLCLFAPCSTRHNCVILCTYFVYFRNAQSYIFVLFRAMREMTKSCSRIYMLSAVLQKYQSSIIYSLIFIHSLIREIDKNIPLIVCDFYTTLPSDNKISRILELSVNARVVLLVQTFQDSLNYAPTSNI